MKFSSKTLFNVLASDDLDWTTVLASIDQQNVAILETSTVDTFLIYRTNSLWENLEIEHLIDEDTDISLTLFRPVYLQDLDFNLFNSDLKVNGKALFSPDPLDMHLENITFDFDYASMGYVAEIDCNYPEA